LSHPVATLKLQNDESNHLGGFAAARSASEQSTAETANSIANTIEKIGCLTNVSPLILTFSPLRGEGTGGGRLSLQVAD
jgi:hypothetical protein